MKWKEAMSNFAESFSGNGNSDIKTNFNPEKSDSNNLTERESELSVKKNEAAITQELSKDKLAENVRKEHQENYSSPINPIPRNRSPIGIW
ncbi:hypothetical protein BH10ACI1_BH10ACI1_11600 [soil metagenome]